MTVFSAVNLHDDSIKQSACICHTAQLVYRRIPLFLTLELKTENVLYTIGMMTAIRSFRAALKHSGSNIC
jgi:hypothetical protein